MSALSAPRILRTLLWILLPLATLFGILYCSPAPFTPQAVEPLPDTPAVQGPAPSYEVALPLQHADGSPAPEGMVLFFGPELATSRMDAEGVAHVRFRRDGKMRFLAYAPGHALLEGERETARAEHEAVRLAPLADAVLPSGDLLEFLPRTIRLQDEQERPLQNVLVLLRPTGARGTEPWVAFTDEEGTAQFPDATVGALECEAYAPGFPPRRASMFARWDIAEETTSDLRRLEVATVEVTGLPPQGLLSWKRVDLNQLLSMVQVEDDGRLLLGPVPLGTYRVQVGSRQLELALQAGRQTVSFSAMAAPGAASDQ